MSNVVPIKTGYTGKLMLIDQDGNGREVWAESGEIHVPCDASFMVVPAPMEGCFWEQIELDNKEGE